MVNGIAISREDAYFLHRLLTDIIEIDARARCSDSYFRSHFMSIIKTGLASGAYDRLNKALTALTAPEVVTSGHIATADAAPEPEYTTTAASTSSARKRRKAET